MYNTYTHIHTQTTFWYSSDKGAAVESWYSSCVVGPVEEIHGGVGGYGGSEHVGGGSKRKSETKSGSPAPATVAPDGKLSFPYPAEASEHTPTICNFSGKTYWFTFEDTGKEEWSEGKGYV